MDLYPQRPQASKSRLCPALRPDGIQLLENGDFLLMQVRSVRAIREMWRTSAQMNIVPFSQLLTRFGGFASVQVRENFTLCKSAENRGAEIHPGRHFLSSRKFLRRSFVLDLCWLLFCFVLGFFFCFLTVTQTTKGNKTPSYLYPLCHLHKQ